MKIKELIEELSKFDPETEVLGMCTDPTGFNYKSPIKSIDFGNPYDSNGYSGIDSSEMNWSECYDEDEDTGEEIYIGTPVILLDLGDV
jgi:hypothetical protein